MTRVLSPRGGLPAGTGVPFTVLAGVWAGAGLAALAWTAGSAASWVSGHGWSGPPLDIAFARDLLTGGPVRLWPHVPAAALWTTFAIAGVLATALVAVPGWLLLGRRQSAGEGIAVLTRADHVAALMPTATRRRALALRPSLAAHTPRAVVDAETGIALGVLATSGSASAGPLAGTHRGRSRVLRASWEDVILAVMAPRAGKTTALAIPTVLDAPGAIVATSNKADLWAATAALRAADTGERAWTFDPQGITSTPQEWWWNPLAAVASVEEAARLAQHFIAEVRSDASGSGAGRDFWTSAAHDLLTALLLAAAAGGRTLVDVYAWLNDPTSPVAAQLLADKGYLPLSAALTGRQHGAPETRDGIYETARTAAACLRDPAILAWVTPTSSATSTGTGRGSARAVEFDAAAFPGTRQSLYLLSKDGAGGAAPLVAALTDQVIRDGVRAAERSTTGRGRLDPPMVAVLDEAANICRIGDLPDLYSHLGSRGIIPITILQSYRQGVRVWGQAGMDTLWSAATVKILGAGIDDARLAEDVSRLVGEHDVTIRSYSDGDRARSTSTALRRQRILPPEDLRALPRGSALLLATGMRAALVTLLPSYAGPRAGDITAAIAQAGVQVADQAQGHHL